MRRISPTDAIALLGLALLAAGVAVRLGPDIAVALVGGLLLVYAVLASLGESPKETP